MLNKKGERELAYVVKINDVLNIEGVNNQVAVVNGWTVFVKRNEFKPGDLAVYFEIDSKVPAVPCFEFLAKYGYKVKTQKFVKGKVISQGLLVHPKALDLKDYKEGDFLTKELGVVYYDPDDNARKADLSKYTSMQARHKKFFKTKFAKWLMKREWGRKICFFFLGKKKDKKTDWPNWVVKTDEERCQNCFEQMKALNTKWIRTEKIDGTSTTFTMKQANPKKREMLVCSRNVVFNAPNKEDKNYYRDTDGNVYLEMAEKYNIEKVLNDILDENQNFEYVTIQGETYVGTIQKRNYGPEHRLAVFNIIYKENGKAPLRLNPEAMRKFLLKYPYDSELVQLKDSEHSFRENKFLETVPILDSANSPFELPETCNELLKIAGDKSKVDGGMREGIVLRSIDGKNSFKAVDNEFLAKYHG